MGKDPYAVPTTHEPHHAGTIAPVSSSVYCPSSQRRRNDTACTVAWCILMAFGVVAGLACMLQSGKDQVDSSLLTASFYTHSMTCDPVAFQKSVAFYTRPTSGFNNFQSANPPPPPPAPIDIQTEREAKTLAVGIALWLPLTIVLGIPASLLYLYLFRKHPLTMVKISLYGTLALLAGVTVLGLIAALPVGILLLVLFLAMLWLTWRVQDQLPLCAELLGVASRALMENLHIISSNLLISFCSMGVMVYLFVAIISATHIGKVVKNPDMPPGAFTVASPDGEIGICKDNWGNSITCCQWQIDRFPTAYIILTCILLSWTSFVIMQIKLHVVADVVAQWYYKPVGAFTNEAPKPSVKVAVKHALTTGFGTIVFAAGILFVLNCLRKLLRRRNHWLGLLLNCMLQPILALLQKFTQFATITAAVTGLPFIDAAKKMYEALARCLFQTDSVWWVPDLVIGMVVWVMALIWAALPLVTMGLESHNWGVSFGIAAFCFIIMVIILALTAGILMDIVNTLYCCFALDRDNKVITRPEVHTVYNQVIALTSPDAVIQNPGGDLAYGAAEEGRVGPSQPPPYPQESSPLLAGSSVQMSHQPPAYQPYSAMQHASIKP